MDSGVFELSESLLRVYTWTTHLNKIIAVTFSHTYTYNSATQKNAVMSYHICCVLNQSHSLPFQRKKKKAHLESFQINNFTISENLPCKLFVVCHVNCLLRVPIKRFLVISCSHGPISDIKNAKVDKEIVYFMLANLIAKKHQEILHLTFQ